MTLRLWRVLFAEAEDRALEPVTGPEGRFHHDGQRALYACLTPEGAATSLTRYLRPDDPPRVMVPLGCEGGRLFDIDAEDAGPPRDVAMHRWDKDRVAGRRPPTWDLSDRLRARGYHGLIYPSRLRPDRRNIVLFRWSDPGTPRLFRLGPARPWVPPR